MSEKMIFPDKTCPVCGKNFNRRRLPCGHLEAPTYFAIRQFCSFKCFSVRKNAADKTCVVCGVRFNRKTRPCGRIESPSDFAKRRYCSASCFCSVREKKSVVTEDGLRKRAQKYVGPTCESCGTESKLCVHHKNRNPADNAFDNRMTLCASCHSKWHHRHGHFPKMRIQSMPGERNPSAKLKVRDVHAIRELLGTGRSQQTIGDRFGVSQVLVSRIKLGKTWGGF